MRSSPFRLDRVSRLVAFVLAVVAVAACSDTSGPSSPDGDYSLSQINGSALPYRMYSDTNYTVDVTRSALSIKGDGSFWVTLTSEERVEGFLSTYVDSAAGVWRQDGEIITLTMSDSTKQKGTWAGSTLAITDSTSVPVTTYLYTR
jgi:hypothetical protein